MSHRKASRPDHRAARAIGLESWAASAVLAMMSILPASQACAAQPTLESTFQAISQRLFDAIAIGDKAVWDRRMDPHCLVTTEDGEVLDKSGFLSQLRPLPTGFVGKGQIRNLTVRANGGTAVVHYWIDETENIHGRQQLQTTYVETDTYVRRSAGWKILAMQITVVPRDPAPLTSDRTEWTSLVGVYRFPGEAAPRYRVFVRDDRLLGGRDEQSAKELIPLAPLTYFQAGSIHLIIFVKDPSGAVSELRELHKYNEVLMERVAPTAVPPDR